MTERTYIVAWNTKDNQGALRVVCTATSEGRARELASELVEAISGKRQDPLDWERGNAFLWGYWVAKFNSPLYTWYVFIIPVPVDTIGVN